MQTGKTNYTYKYDLEKSCSQHDLVYGKYKDLTKRTEPDNVLKDKSLKNASNPKDDEYKRRSASVDFL